MNISGLIIKIDTNQQVRIISDLRRIPECDVHSFEGAKIVITLECSDLSSELKRVKEIETLEGVCAVELVYTYNEDELEEARTFIEKTGDFPSWLNDETLPAGKIKYQGDLKKKF